MAQRKKPQREKGGESPRRPKRRGGRSIPRWILYPAALLLTLAAVGEVYAGTVALRVARRHLAEAFGGGGLRSVSFDLFSLSARIRGLAIPQQPPFGGLGNALEIPECELGLDWRTLWSWDPLRFRKVELRGARARILRTSAGLSSARLMGACVDRLAALVGRRNFRIDSLRIEGGQVEFCELAPDRMILHTLPVRAIQAQCRGLGNLGEGQPDWGAWEGSASVAEPGAAIRWKGKAGPLRRPFSFELERLECDRLALVAIGPQIEETVGCRPVTGTLSLRVHASCPNGSLEQASLSLHLTGASFEPITMAGREFAAYVRARDGRVDEEFSVTGAWDRPKVRTSGFVSRIVWGKIGQGMVGLISSPFRLVASIFGGE